MREGGGLRWEKNRGRELLDEVEGDKQEEERKRSSQEEAEGVEQHQRRKERGGRARPDVRGIWTE